MRTAFGAAKLVWNVTDKQWRTALGDHGGCVFLVGNRCEIHAHEAYPVVCEGFPFRPDESEVDICPELLTGKHPDLDVLFDPVTKQLRVAH